MGVVRRSERGQAVPLLAALLAVAAALAFVVAELGAAAVHRARARTAADAAALAGAADGEGAARSVAEANGAALVGFHAELGAEGETIVEVVVRHGPAQARATAEGTVAGRDPRGLSPAAAASLARAEQLLGRAVEVVDVAGDGRRFTVDPASGEAVASVAAQAGLCRQGAGGHPVHFAPCPPSSQG